MTELGSITDRGTVRIERTYPVDADVLWTYLTTRDGLNSWMADGEIGPERAYLRFHDNPEYPIEGAVLVWEPPHVVELEWNGGTTQPGGSVVRFELTPGEGGTLLSLTHSRVSGPDAALDFASGWHFHLDTLTAVAAGAEPPADRQTWDDLRAQYLTLTR